MAAVTISQGKLKGAKAKTSNGFEYYEFLEIPYAKPPIGNLRFKAPQSPEAWVGERDATKASLDHVACHKSLLMPIDTTVGSEDCLYLNVFTPKIPGPKEYLPVMVYIHGGGFIEGSGTIKDYAGPDYLIEYNVVVVTINYRLSVLGFLNLGITRAAGNMGLKDQVKALQWVQNNISTFGGNKNNVNIFGCSAGSASVDYLLLSPMAKGLFHKAILESGSSLNHWAINLEPQELNHKLLSYLNYDGPLDDNQKILDFLSKLKDTELISAASYVINESSPNKIFCGFVPTIEKDFRKGDEFLTAHPYTLLKDGIINSVPIIAGFCDYEGYLSVYMKSTAFKELVEGKRFINHFPYTLDEDYNEKLSAAYSTSNKTDAQDEFAVDFFTDLDFAAGIWLSTKIKSRKVPVFYYRFKYDGNGNLLRFFVKNNTRKGAAHADELGYLIRMSFSPITDEEDVLMKDRITKLWTDFAKTGNPTPSTSDIIPIQWPKFTEENTSYLVLDKELTVQSNYEPERMALFEELYEKFEK